MDTQTSSNNLASKTHNTNQFQKLAKSMSTYLMLMMMVCLMTTTNAWAGVNELSYGMRASGTPAFDADDDPGHDSNAGNDIIRSNDTATYTVGYSLDQSDTNNLIVLEMGTETVPAGYTGSNDLAYFSPDDLPVGANGCDNVSSTPVSDPPPVGTSGVTADGKKIFCYQTASRSASQLDFRYRVRGGVPNGATIAAPTVTYQSQNNPAQAPSTILDGDVGGVMYYDTPDLNVSAAPRWQVAKKRSSGNGLFIPGSGENGEDGYVMAFSIGIYAQGSRKGLEPLDTASIAENFGDTDMPGAKLVNWNMFQTNMVNADFSASGANGCGAWNNDYPRRGNFFDNAFYVVNDNGDGVPYESGDAAWTVANGGTCDATAIDNTAKTATLTLTGTDFSLTHYPVFDGARRSRIINEADLDSGSNEWWVAQKSILIWVPVDDVNPGQTDVFTNNATLSGTSITGQTNPASSSAVNSAITRSTTGSLSKIYSTISTRWDLDSAAPDLSDQEASRDPNITGDSPVNQAFPGQLLTSRMILRNRTTEDLGPGYLCEKIDNARVTLADLRNYSPSSDYRTDPGTGVLFAMEAGLFSNMPITWELGVGGTNTTNPSGAGTWSTHATVSNEYQRPSSNPADSDHGAATCADGDAHAWFSSIEDLIAGGYSLSDVNRVRGSYTNFPGAYGLVAYLPLEVNSTYAFTSQDNAPGGAFTAGDPLLDDYSPNQVVAVTDQGEASERTFRASDAMRIQSTEYLIISKSAASPYDTDSAFINRGSIATYELSINAFSTTDTHQTDVTVWDVIPNHMTYLAGSSTQGGNAIADPVCEAPGVTPASGPFAAGSVQPGFTACYWVLTNQTVTKARRGDASADLPLLTFQAAVALDAPENTVLFNTATADSTNNNFFPATYQGATQGFQCVSGGVCDFSNWNLRTNAQTGLVLNKQVNRAVSATDSSFEYVLNYATIGSTLTGLRVMDVLPYASDPRSSSFSGTVQLAQFISDPVASAGPPATDGDSDMLVRYTKQSPANIVLDPYGASQILTGVGSNGATQTIWCTQAQFGSGDCPASLAEVTAILAEPQGEGDRTIEPGSNYFLTVPVVTDDNVIGDVYGNRFRADSPDLTARNPGSNLVTTTIKDPDLVLSKTAAESSIDHDETVNFTLVVRNNAGTNVSAIANLPGTQIRLEDTMPTGLRLSIPVNATGWNCAASTATKLDCLYSGTLPVLPDTQLGGNIVITTTGQAPGSWTNTASVTLTGQTDADTTNNTDQDTVQVQSIPVTVAGRVYREGNGNTADDGSSTDPGLVTSVSLSCTSPTFTAGPVTTDSNGTFSFASVPSGATCTITQVQPTDYDIAYTNQGGGGTGSSTLANGDRTISLVVPSTGSSNNQFASSYPSDADMTSTVSCSPNPAAAGATVSCNAVCENIGTGTVIDATCSFTNLSSLPGSPTQTCATPGNVSPGSSLSCSMSFTMPTDGSSVSVTAGTSGANDINGGTDPAAGNNPSSTSVATGTGTVSGRVYRESGTNTTDDGQAVDPGLVTQVSLSCTSPSFSAGPVDTAADGSYNFANVPAGASCLITQVQPTDYDAAYTTPGTGGTGQSTLPSGDRTIAITTTLTGSNGNNFASRYPSDADMTSSVSCTPNPAQSGATVSCTITCENAGTGTVINGRCQVTNLAELPGNPTPSCDADRNVAAGDSLSCQIDFTMPSDGSTVDVTAGASGDNDINGGTDPRAGNNPSSSSVAPLLGGVSGRVYREGNDNTNDDGAGTDPGLTTQVSLTCTSPDYDGGTTTTDAQGNFNFANVPVGATCVITQVQPVDYDPDYSTQGTGGTATETLPDGNRTITLVVPDGGSNGNNFASKDKPEADMTSTVTCSPNPTKPGAEVECIVRCNNVGNSVVRDASCQVLDTDSLPNPEIGCDTPRDVAVGESLECIFTFIMPDTQVIDINVGTTGTNDQNGGTDPTGGNNSSSTSVTAIAPRPAKIPASNHRLLLWLTLILMGMASWRLRDKNNTQA